MSATDDVVTLVRDYRSDEALLDADSIVRAGQIRLRRRRQAATAAALAVVVAASVPVAAIALGGTSHRSTAASPAAQPLPSKGLLATDPARSRIETMSITSSGWRAVVYLNDAGALCQGWVDPTTAVLVGQCEDAPQPGEVLHPGSATALTPPILVEPQAGASGGTVQGFGLYDSEAGTQAVAVSDVGVQLDVTVSAIRDAWGRGIWLATFPTSRPSPSTLDTLTALNEDDTAIDTVHFAPPISGWAESSLSYKTTPSPSPSQGR